MKKFYLLLAIACLGFMTNGAAQTTFTATHTGNWSSGATWDINGVPASPCNNCSITINANVTVTLNTAVVITGNTQLKIGTDATSAAKLVIPASSNNQFDPHNTITFPFSATGTSIKLSNANSVIDASAGPAPAGQYDGIFIVGGPFGFKLVGTPSYPFGYPGFPVPSSYGSVVAGPASINSTGVLPILLENFQAAWNNSEVDLSWTTAQEINSDHFGVERSIDGSHWQPIGTIPARGFSGVAVDYSFVDGSPLNGANYYRLQLVDRDAKYKYSPVVVVRSQEASGLSVFPNPARDFVNVSLGTDLGNAVSIRLISPFGQVLQERKLSHTASVTVSFPVANYPQGTYLVQVIGADGSAQTSKVLIGR